MMATSLVNDHFTLVRYGADAIDGPGWYYFDTSYPEEGAIGAFETALAAFDDAMEMVPPDEREAIRATWWKARRLDDAKGGDDGE